MIIMYGYVKIEQQKLDLHFVVFHVKTIFNYFPVSINNSVGKTVLHICTL